MSPVFTEKTDLSRHLIKYGPKFRSHTIVFQESKAFLKPTLLALLFCLVYVLVGVFLLCLAVFVYSMSRQMDLVIFLSIAGTAIATFGFMLLRPFMRHSVFDKGTNEFCNNADRPLELGNISSLQITNKIITSKHGLNYPCYELNVLTKYGRRMNILNHNDLVQMELDGGKLSGFLEVELVDCQKEIIL